VSAGMSIPHARAREAAEALVRTLWNDCERIEIAGSLRRGKTEVHDSEGVAIATGRTLPDRLFGAVEENCLDVRITGLLELSDNSGLQARYVENKRADGSVDVQTKLGPAFKALVYHDIPVDLFVVRPPASWGVIFGLRTGPGDWNIQLVTDCKGIGRRVAGGQVERWVGASSSWEPVPTPEEGDFFAAIGQPWVEPKDRSPDRVQISRALVAG
jgi:DNA polymerase/3'-5' exonuclease PolX